MRKFLFITVLTCVSIFAFIIWKIPKDQEHLSKRFKNGYKSRAINVGRGLITFADSAGNCDQNPIVYFIKDGKIESQFEIAISGLCVDNEKFTEFNGLVISEWVGHAFGSGGLRGLIIWQMENNQLKPLTGYPENIASLTNKAKISVTNGLDKVFEFPVVDMDSFSWYQPDNKKALKLLYADPIWDLDAGECHSCPHQWQLQSFFWENRRWTVDKNFNQGRTLITKDKFNGDESENLKTLMDRFN